MSDQAPLVMALDQSAAVLGLAGGKGPVGGGDRPQGSVRDVPVAAALPRADPGAFDPVRWAADPNRRSDHYDERAQATAPEDTITGFPGAAGVVEGTLRVISTTEGCRPARRRRGPRHHGDQHRLDPDLPARRRRRY